MQLQGQRNRPWSSDLGSQGEHCHGERWPLSSEVLGKRRMLSLSEKKGRWEKQSSLRGLEGTKLAKSKKNIDTSC